MTLTLAHIDPNQPFHTAADHGPTWWQVATSETGQFALLVGGVSLLGLLIAAWVLRRAHGGYRRRNPITDNDGTATMEFALVFPILLFFIMSLGQSSMLMGGNYMVHYAAYAAARSAIVHVPIDLADDPANRYTQSDGRTKHDRIREAAIIALTGVSGEQESADGSGEADLFAEALGDYFEGTGPPWVERKAADRMRYAYDNTRIMLGYPRNDTGLMVTLVELEAGENREYGPRDAITVFVEHKLNLGVPYANRIFATGENEGSAGYHRTIKTNCTLTNEGMRDELPPQPTVPRVSLPGELQDLREQLRQENQ